MTKKEFEALSTDEIEYILADGGRFVVFTYTISIILMTFRHSSSVFLLRRGEWPIKHGWPYLLLSLILGWWGIPWGPIYTIQSLYYAFAGKDVTKEILEGVEEKEEEAW